MQSPAPRSGLSISLFFKTPMYETDKTAWRRTVTSSGTAYIWKIVQRSTFNLRSCAWQATRAADSVVQRSLPHRHATDRRSTGCGISFIHLFWSWPSSFRSIQPDFSAFKLLRPFSYHISKLGDCIFFRAAVI